MSDIRFNQWLHNSGTGGISQDSAGHVGIGTTVPTHINALTNNNSILHVGIVSCNTLNAASKIEGSIDDWIIHQSDTNTRFGFPSTDTFTVETAGSERLRITSTGQVAIGTDTAETGYILSMHGDLSLGEKAGTDNTFIDQKQDGDLHIINSGRTANGASGTPGCAGVGINRYNNISGGTSLFRDFCVYNGKNSKVLYVDGSTSRVAIGTDNPAHLLHLEGASPVIQFEDTDNAANIYSLINAGGSAGRLLFQVDPANAGTDSYVRFDIDGAEKFKIASTGDITTSGTTKIKPHTIGIGTTATTNTGVGTAYGEMMYNTTDDKLQIYTKSNKWYNVHNWTDSIEGYYKSTTAASADGLNHYWPGNSSQSLISNLLPNNTSNSPVVNLTVDSYHGTYPYFNFYSGNNELGWRFTKGGTKWGNGPFTIAFWVRPQASTLESESTFVQLGSHSGLRSLYTVSTDASRQLKAITIGDDTGVHSSATLSTGWQHVVVTYETNRNTKYYINGSNVRTFNHSGNLDVGTSSQYIYIGYGHWNSSSSNKASMSQMSDIGIWDSDALTATEVLNLYKAKRIISGY